MVMHSQGKKIREFSETHSDSLDFIVYIDACHDLPLSHCNAVITVGNRS